MGQLLRARAARTSLGSSDSAAFDAEFSCRLTKRSEKTQRGTASRPQGLRMIYPAEKLAVNSIVKSVSSAHG